jgi:ribosome biogenesis GTPase
MPILKEEKMNLTDYGFIPAMLSTDNTLQDNHIPARVTAVHKERYALFCKHGECFGRLKSSNYFVGGSEEFPATGDFVLIKYNLSGDSQILKTLPRRSKFSRSDFSGHAAGYAKTVLEQVVAANFDFVFILSSLNRDFNVNRIMRYLTQAWQSGGQPVVVLTKADLPPDYKAYLSDVQKAAPGLPIHAVSSHTGFGLDSLDEYLQPGKTIVFLGMSGVGKSSLLNALMRKEVMAVKAIREDDSRGRHTTTHRQLFMLPSGAMVIDTPGMRELGLFGADEGISTEFADVEELFAQCRFTNCRHRTEPGCAVLAALKDGSLPRERWEQYVAQKQENYFVDDKAGYLIDKNARQKSIARWSKQMKKNGWLRE